MAGGMRRREPLGSVADRVARSAAPSVTAPATPAVKHCWVHGPHGRVAGLLLAWEQRGDGWWGRVVHPVATDADGWAVVVEWVPASLLGSV
jgi:hypothetical protein